MLRCGACCCGAEARRCRQLHAALLSALFLPAAAQSSSLAFLASCGFDFNKARCARCGHAVVMLCMLSPHCGHAAGPPGSVPLSLLPPLLPLPLPLPSLPSIPPPPQVIYDGIGYMTGAAPAATEDPA